MDESRINLKGTSSRAAPCDQFDADHETAHLVRASAAGGLKCHEDILELLREEQRSLCEMALRVREDWLFERKCLQQLNGGVWAPLVLEASKGRASNECRLRWKIKPYGKFKGSVPARDVSRPGEVVVSVFDLLRHAKPWEIDLTLLTETRCARIRLAWKHIAAFRGALLSQPRKMVARIDEGQLHEARLSRVRVLR